MDLETTCSLGSSLFSSEYFIGSVSMVVVCLLEIFGGDHEVWSGGYYECIASISMMFLPDRFCQPWVLLFL